MQEPYTNICKACRKEADMTQEEWAEELYVSVETVKAWEGNLRVPANFMVARMVELCGNTFYAYKHLRQTSDALGVLPEAEQLSLPRAAIQIVNRVLAFADGRRDRQLLRIAEDGVIDDTEKELFDQIVSELSDIIGAAYTLRYCSEEQKKAAPAQQHGNGPVVESVVETNHTGIIQQDAFGVKG